MRNLKLSREAYSGIFLGTVQQWNDEKIQLANPEIPLPEEPIQVIVRADKSGTSAVFTKHLSAISEEFKTSVGESKDPQWKVESLSKEKGNAGIAAWIGKTPNSIGYIEYGYATKK